MQVLSGKQSLSRPAYSLMIIVCALQTHTKRAVVFVAGNLAILTMICLIVGWELRVRAGSTARESD